MDQLSYMTDIRRHLHRHPCLSGREEETAAWLAARLEELGYQPKMAAEGTGLYCDLPAGEGKPFILLRADIDALPLQEQTGLAFASENPGVMHACAHDGHAAMVMGAARALREAGELPCSVRFLFQPAEEVGGGAARMIGEGCLPEHLAAVFACHIWASVPSGVIGLRRGTLMASNDRFTVRFLGRTAHCAMRREGQDALQAGARMAALLDRIPASLPPEEAALVFVGKLQAGNAYNVVADCCELEGTVRTMSAAAREKAEQELRRLAEGVAALCGVRAEVDYSRQYPPLGCDGRVVERLLGLLPGAEELQAPFLTAEDFAFFTEQAPGAMLLLGCRDESHPEPLHSAAFTFDETLLAKGCDAFCRIAREDWSPASGR